MEVVIFRRRIVGSLLAVAAISLSTIGCQATMPPEPTEPAPPPSSPPERIVLVVVDTLRADHLGSYGYRRPVSPFLDSLAERGVLFLRAYAQSSTTQPSHASLFTSLYPLQHNVHRNGFRLDESYLTLAELLAAQGFRTAAFTSTDAHFDWGGLRQGFEHYDELARVGSANRDAKRGPEEKLYRPAAETVDAAIQWLSGVSPDDPFFLWVHLFDPHGPREPPAEHLQRLWPKTVAERLAHIEFLKTDHRLDTSENGGLRRQILLYDGEIAYVDAELARLYSELDRRGLGNEALWIVTSDHGEGLENHGWFGHSKQLYNVQLHVPLIFHFANELYGGSVIADRVVEHVDLVPTLMDLVNAEDALEAQVLPIQGQSLVPLMRGIGEGYTKRYAFAQRSLYPQRRKLRIESMTKGQNYALQTLKAKYLMYTKGDDEFYDLARDPYETRNRVGGRSSDEDELRIALQEMIDRLSSERAPLPVDSQAIERLRALGYLQ